MPPSANPDLSLQRLVAIVALILAVIACIAGLIYGANGAVAELSPSAEEREEAVADRVEPEPVERVKTTRTFTPEELGFEGPASLLKWSARAHPKHVRGALKKVDELLGTPKETLAAIASCESGGNPRSVSSDGTYRGRYQFDHGAWQSVGGRGDPAKAPGWEQDVRAAILIDARGTSPWPNCG